MSLLDRVDEERSGEEFRAVSVPWQPWLSPLMPFNIGGPAHPSKTAVGLERSLSLSPLYSAVRLIADKVSSLPLKQYRELPDGKVQRMSVGQLLTKPSAYGTPQDWLFAGTASALAQGNGIGLIVQRDGYGYPTQVEWLPMDAISEQPDEQQPWNPYRNKLYFMGAHLPLGQILHIRAFVVPGKILGISPVRQFMNLIGQGQDALDYGASWYRSGGFPPGTFQNQEVEVESEDADEIKRRLVKAIQRHEPLVYGKDWEYNPIAVPPAEAQFLEAMQMNATQIAAIYGIPPERIGGRRGDSLTYTTQEDEAISLLTDTLQPWLTRWEAVLYEHLPQSQFMRFNVNSMLRVRTEQRYQIYKMARDMGIHTANEIRDLEEMESLGEIGDDPIPLSVLVAMSRMIKEIPKTFEDYVVVSKSDIAEMASQEKIAKDRVAQPKQVVNMHPGGSSNGAGSAKPGKAVAKPAASHGDQAAAAKAARARWQGDYDFDAEEIRDLMNGAQHG